MDLFLKIDYGEEKMKKISRQKIMFMFFVGQLIVGIGLLFNPMPFDFILRVFGMFLIVISPLWLIIFRLERIAKVRDVEKKADAKIKKHEDEPIGEPSNES